MELYFVPVPDSATTCALVRAESLIVRMPVRVPVASGEKVALMVQSFPAVSALGQLFVSAKFPLTLMLVIFSGVAPGFVSVTAIGALVVPSATLPKLRLVGA